MKRHELEHIIRAAAGNSDTDEIVVIGSQAIFGSVESPPEELTKSLDADVFPKNRPEDAELIEGGIGEESIFHHRFGYFAHGVGPETATLPAGAWDRLIPLRNENTKGKTGWCLEIHDLAVSKLCAGREKDQEYVAALLRHKLINPEVVRERLKTVETKEIAKLASDRLKRWSRERQKEQPPEEPPL